MGCSAILPDNNKHISMNVDKLSEDTEYILKKMCEVVGADFAKVKFKSSNWYLKHTWTEEEQQDFIDWLAKFYQKRHGYTKKNSVFLANSFVGNYGWKVNNM